MSKSDSSTTRVLHEAGEWRTLAVIVAVYGLTVLTVVRYDVLTAWLAVPLLAVLGAWHLSMQHEVLHGHPFKNQFSKSIHAVALAKCVQVATFFSSKP